MDRREGEPPARMLLALYLVLAMILIAVLVIVGVYGT
jgi:flagellar biogenesis protein FliO